MENEKVKKILAGMVSIPSLPSVVREVMAMIERKNTSAQDLQSIISRDPAIAAKVLKLVNSSYYGFPSKIASIQHALVILGFNTLRSLVLSLSAFDSLSHGLDRSVFDFELYTIHSNGCAITAKIIAKNLPGVDEEDAFAAGLLHDIGKVILCKYFPAEFGQVKARIAASPVASHVAEKEVLGYTHAEVGSWLAEKWRLPEKIIRSIQHHHEPAAIAADPMTAIVHVSDILCVAKAVGVVSGTVIPPLDAKAWALLKLTRQRLVEIMAEIDQQIDKAIELFQRG